MVSGDFRPQLQAVHCLWESVQSGVVLPGAGLTHGSTYQPYDNLKGFGREAPDRGQVTRVMLTDDDGWKMM